jgi:hypothetical protein
MTVMTGERSSDWMMWSRTMGSISCPAPAQRGIHRERWRWPIDAQVKYPFRHGKASAFAPAGCGSGDEYLPAVPVEVFLVEQG